MSFGKDKLLSRKISAFSTVKAIDPARPSGVIDDPERDSLPASHKFANSNKRMLEVLRRSYRMKTPQNDNLWEVFGERGSPDNITFVQAMDTLEARGLVTVVEQVFTRLDRSGVDLFDNIFAITNLYKSNSSWGFFCTMRDVPAARAKLMQSVRFCRDLPPGEATHQRSERNQERTCFRELSGIGTPGLHVCLVKEGQQNERGGYHNIHIDPHQIGKERTKHCSCWYAGIQHHFKDVGDYIIRAFVVKKAIAVLRKKPGPFSIPESVLQSMEDAGTRFLLDLLLSASGDFDSLEMKLSDPKTSLPASLDVIPGAREALAEQLKDLKAWYMNNV
jgi:hypothetical protein